MASAAVAWFAHVSCYRLARAEEIRGLNLAHPDERLLLWLQLRLSEELGLQPPGPRAARHGR